MSPDGIICFKLDIGNEGNRIVIAREKGTGEEIGSRALNLHLPGSKIDNQIKVYIPFDKSKFPNIKDISDITFWQRPLNVKEETVLETTRIFKLTIRDA